MPPETSMPTPLSRFGGSPTVLQAAFSGTTTPTANADAVLLDLHTTIVIPDYHLYYSAPISSFHPNYHALADGSLVATPFIADMRSANINLVWTSALAMFFFVTSCTTVQYIRRGKIKKKGLFYLLLVSQLSGVVGMLATIIPFFDQFVSCKSVTIVSLICTSISYSLLMTGILGMKAYRCLGNAKFVLVVLAVLRTAAIGLAVLNMTKLTAFRRITGSCLPMEGTSLLAAVVIVQTVESAFISSCFLYAVLKSSHEEGQGRMSIHPSVKDYWDRKSFGVAHVPENDVEQISRGWWDYVPEPSQSEAHTHPTGTPNPKSNSDHSGPLHAVGNRLHIWSYPPTDAHETMMHHKISVTGDPTQRPRQTPSIAFSTQHTDTNNHDRLRPSPRAYSPAPPSVMSRLSKYIPRMQLFRDVLRNELAYTALLTIIYLVIGLLMALGIGQQSLMDPAGLIELTWLIVSVFTLQSFGRVVNRHEREAILQHPAAWDPVYRAGLEASRAFGRGRTGRALSPISVVSRVPRRALRDPFDDIPPVPSTGGGSFAHAARDVQSSQLSHRTLSPSAERVRPWMFDRRPSVSSSGSYEPSAVEVLLHADPLQTSEPWNPVVAMPSPISGQYPPSISRSSIRSESSQSDSRRLMRPTSLGAESSLRRGGRRPSTSSCSRTRWEPPHPLAD